MNAIHYIGFDVHKKTISFCVKTAAGQIVEEGTLEAERTVLRRWAAARKRGRHGAMEATLFRAWVFIGALRRRQRNKTGAESRTDGGSPNGSTLCQSW